MRIRISLLILFISTLSLFAPEALLIDFNDLDNTTIDFSRMAVGKNYPESAKKDMVVNLDPSRWLIKVNSSSWTKEARDKTYLLTITNSQTYPDQKVLGVRIFFPQRMANSYATITPPFEIPSYYDDPENPTGLGDMFIGRGVVRNVGILRKLSVVALGNNFRYSLYVRIKDHHGDLRDIFVGYLDYQGWKDKSWLNPNIEQELKMREVRKKTKPHYPDEYPYVKLVALIIDRVKPEITGNFVTMIKEINVEYDEAIIETGKTEDNQEAIFGIYKEELIQRAKSEMWSVDRRIYLQWREKQKMHKEETAAE